MNTDRKVFACRNRFRVVVLAAVVVLSLGVGVTILQAQQVTGRLLGSVTDTSGAAVPGAPITITNQDTGVVRNTVSTSDGLYNDPQIPAGTYTVEVQAQGFSPARVKDVVIIVGSDSKVDLKVTVGSLTQTVTVTEAAPQVDTTSSSIGGIVDEQKVSDLPLNGRNWTDLTLMQAGISQLRTNSASGGMAGTVYSSMGADIRSNMYLLDGAIMQNLFAINNASVLGTSLGVDGIKEYKVVTNMFGAEYGLMMGSQTVLVSKGGTNQWHGDVYDYMRNSVFDSRQHFDVLDALNVNHCGTDKSLAYPCKRNTPYQRNNFGGAFGGPIKKDKTFVWVVYEGLRERLGQTTTSTSLPLGCFYDTADVLHATVPANIDNSATNPGITTTSNGTKVACAGAVGSTIGTGAASGTIKINNPAVLTVATLFPRPNIGGTATNNFTFPFIRPSTENYGQIRLDQNFSAKDSAFGRYTHDDADQTAALAFPQAVTTLHSSEQFITGSENHILRPTLLNTFRASFSRTQIIANFVHVAGQPAVPSLDLYWPFPSTVGIGSGVTTWATNTQTTPPPGNTQNIVTASDDIFWTKGKHAFKFGVLYNHFQDSLNDLLFAGGTEAFGSNTAFFTGNYSSVQFIAAGSDQNRAWIYHTLGFYAQDDFRVLPRLTLNLGLRYEFFTPPRTISSQTTYQTPDPQHAVAPFGVAVPAVSTNPSLHNFGPRIGLAWDVRGNGKTAVRLGGGIFYDVGLLGGLLTNASFAQEPLVTQQVITNTGASPSLALLLPMDSMLTEMPAAGTVPVTSIAPRSLQYYAQQPTLGQWNFTIDQQLPWGMAVSTSYVGSHGWHLYQVRDLNPIIPAGTVNGIPYNCTPGSTVSGVAGPPPTALTPCTFAASGIYNPVRVNQALGQFYGEVEGANTWYNALEVVVTKRITNGLQFQGAYTFERQIDTGQNQQGTDGTQSSQIYGNPDNTDKAVSSYNIPNSFRFNGIYHVPNLKSENFVAKLEHGWWMASIVTLQSGSPFNVSVNVNRSLSGAANEVDRPNLDPSFNYKTLVTGNPNQWFNPTMFDLPLAGTYGNAPRNLIPGPNYQNVDFSVSKDTRVPKLGEGGIVQFRAEFFNIFNHTNYGTPNGSVTNLSSATAVPAGGQAGSAGIPLNGSVGKITSTVNNNNSARQIQLSLKVIF